jgi:hypothetical protein
MGSANSCKLAELQNCKILVNTQILTRILQEAGHWWLIPIILATQEAEIRRITVGSQPGEIIHKTLSRKNPSQKNGWWSG